MKEMENLIIKLEHSNTFQPSLEGCRIQKIISSISPKTFIALLKEADNKVNPRSAKVNRITKSIYETLETSPELFWFKSKGILIATKNCEQLERNRIRITLSDTDYEGIMDGGHNTFAVALYLLEKLFDDERIRLKDWYECKRFWNDRYEEILNRFSKRADQFRFTIPIEIIAPDGEQGSLDEFYDSIAEICSARNNNVQLPETSKGNQEGYYDPLKKLLANKYSIIWKSGDPGKIKADDVITMASLSLIFLDKQGLLPETFSKKLHGVSLYSSKGKCVDFYNSLMEEIGERENGKSVLNDNLILSALSLTDSILKHFDRLYAEFGRMYNNFSPGYGRMNAVKNTSSKVPFGTIKEEVPYIHPQGFIYPLLYGLIALMKYDEEQDEVSWIIDPSNINLFELDLGYQYIGMMRMVNYDPQKVGKNNAFYNEAESIYRKYLADAKSAID
jgi:hypothetical protein